MLHLNRQFLHATQLLLLVYRLLDLCVFITLHLLQVLVIPLQLISLLTVPHVLHLSLFDVPFLFVCLFDWYLGQYCFELVVIDKFIITIAIICHTCARKQQTVSLSLLILHLTPIAILKLKVVSIQSSSQNIPHSSQCQLTSNASLACLIMCVFQQASQTLRGWLVKGVITSYQKILFVS